MASLFYISCNIFSTGFISHTLSVGLEERGLLLITYFCGRRAPQQEVLGVVPHASSARTWAM